MSRGTAACVPGILAAAVCVVLGFSQNATSANPATRQLNRWLAAYDLNSWDLYSEFLKANFAPHAVNMFQDRSVRRQTGAFDVIKIEEESPTEVTALVNGRDSDKVGRIVLDVETAEPHRITKLQARAIPRPPDLPLPHLNDGELVAKLRDRLEKGRSCRYVLWRCLAG